MDTVQILLLLAKTQHKLQHIGVVKKRIAAVAVQRCEFDLPEFYPELSTRSACEKSRRVGLPGPPEGRAAGRLRDCLASAAPTRTRSRNRRGNRGYDDGRDGIGVAVIEINQTSTEDG